MCEGQTKTNMEDSVKSENEHGMMEVPLEEAAATLEESANEQKDSSGDNDTDNKDDDKPPEHFPWWRGGGIKPRNGTDLGVWDESLEDRANCVSLWWMSYLNPLLSLGSRKVLDAKDVGVPSVQDRAERAYQSCEVEWEKQIEKSREHNAKVKQQWEQQQQKKEKSGKGNNKTAIENGDGDAPAAPTGPPEKKLKEPSISSSLVISFGGWRIALAILLQVIAALLSFVPVLILSDLVGYFEWYNITGGEGTYDGLVHPWVEVVALGVVPLVSSILQTRHNAVMVHCGIFVRTAVSTMLYRKALTVSAAGRAKTSTGQVVNMMSNDTMQLQRFLQFAGFTVVAPLQIIVALFLIYEQVGNATWVGVAYMVFLAPINVKVFGIVATMRRRVLKFSDMRVKMMNEILAGIRIIKFYAWERPFGKEVSRVRKNEMDALTKLAYTVAVGFSIILLSTPIVQPVIVFVTYVNIQDEPLTAATAFTTVALFNLMRFPFAFMPMGLLQYIQSKISLKRLERYLALPELNPYVQDTPPPDTAPDSPYAQSGSISIADGTFSWVDPDGPEIKPVQDEEKKKKKRMSRAERRASRRKSEVTLASTNADEKSSQMSNSMHSMSSATTEDSGKAPPMLTLQNINCRIAPGELVAVVGSVGSGKSSLLSSILGEMESINDSKVYVPRHGQEEKDMRGFASYCTQSPWVVNDTMRGNILFGREYDEDRYNKILDCCALLDDIAVLPAGDMTEIGERGINLSGGQKARVSLARAMYAADTRLLLLDDPLSAVDSHVGEHLFTKAIAGDINTGKTRILVTHHVHVLSRCDKVLVMHHGTIKHQGSYQELISKGVDFAGAVDVSKIKKGEGADAPAEDKIEEMEEKKVSEKNEAEQAAQKKAGATLVKEEEREEGDVAGTAYIRYARAGGWCLAVLVCVIQALGRTSEIMSSFWLARWADDMQTAEVAGEPFSDQETTFYVGIYALFGFLAICGLGGRGIFLAMHRLKASQQLHDGLTESVLRAPVSFFDVTPIGRILNRFAADMDKVDLELTQTISQGINTVFQVLGALGGILIATKGTFMIALIPLGYLYYLIQRWFRKTSTELQRVTSVANSPIFADFSQTLSGTSTIRAYGVQKGFFDKCKHSFDTMNASYILVQLASYWLALRLDVMGGLVGMFIGAVAVGTLESGFIPAGWLGLALSYSIEVTSYLKFGVQMIARMEADMSSVERILYYTDNIEPEAPAETDKDPKEGTWPTSGEIDFLHASMRYRDGPLVLKDLTLTVKAGEKIGVCGRTGSGKSSLMIALFRISEIEKNGEIEIDGVNTREIGTAALRLNLSIIPQDPVMFSNSVRYNLDPFATATDEELWDVLKKVQMGEPIAALPKGLDEEVAEGGENFSQGQRQLLCIARSLLRKPKILVMDEATASIDNETDATIQRMIRENFQDATVLTIAHRLNTIMDSDRILVLDDGHIAELDTPENLLAKKDGHFKAMVEKSREAHSNTLAED